MVAGTYSVVFSGVYGSRAVDWSWKIKNKWARSEKNGSRWTHTEGLDKRAHIELLKHFGLKWWADEYPVGRIISMNPRQLVRERREKESAHDLKKMEIKSMTLGYHARAEDHDFDRR